MQSNEKSFSMAALPSHFPHVFDSGHTTPWANHIQPSTFYTSEFFSRCKEIIMKVQSNHSIMNSMAKLIQVILNNINPTSDRQDCKKGFYTLWCGFRCLGPVHIVRTHWRVGGWIWEILSVYAMCNWGRECWKYAFIACVCTIWMSP